MISTIKVKFLKITIISPLNKSKKKKKPNENKSEMTKRNKKLSINVINSLLYF